MKTNSSIKFFDLIESKKNKTINLAGIMGMQEMDPLEKPIKIKIEGKSTGIHEIPVRIKQEVKDLISLDQLDDLVSNFLATKSEFKTWKENQNI